MALSIGDEYEYNIRDRLGCGSFAIVYKGLNVKTHQIVAIKEIDIDCLINHNNSEKLQQNFVLEVKTMQMLRHPNILKLIKVVTGERNLYMILEYCNAGDLYTYIKKKTTHSVCWQQGICEQDAHQMAVQLKDGLKYMHSMGIIHRDLKPQNILVSQEGESVTIKIADFGFAKILGASQLTETICGSPIYMAPEVLSGQKYTSTADLWSYGVILYEMLVGQTPFSSVKNCFELKEAHNKIKMIELPPYIRITIACRELISSLLVVNTHDRIRWKPFFDHPWMGDITNMPCVMITGSIQYPRKIQSKMVTQSLPLTAMELLKSFEIINQSICIPRSIKGILPDHLSLTELKTELPQWNNVLNTLYDMGQYKVKLSYYSEARTFFQHAVNLGQYVLEIICQCIRELQVGSVTVDELSELCAIDTEVELIIVQFNKSLERCSSQSQLCEQNIKQNEYCKPTERLIYDTAISLEKQGMVEFQIDENHRAIERFTKSIYLLRSIVPFSDEKNKELLSEYIIKLQNMREIMSTTHT